MPTSVPWRAAFMASRKGAKLSKTPCTFTARMRAKTARSSGSSVSVPTLMPALAITMSGAPCSVTKRRQMLDNRSWSVMSTVSQTH